MSKKKLLFHICCAPCSGLLSQQLLADFKVTVYFDNPNIWPEEEFIKRSIEAEKYFKALGVDFIVTTWDHKKWLALSRDLENEPEKGRRCKLCYHYRLENAASFAADNQFPFFTTSLSISPHKDDQAIKNIGQALAKKHHLKFLADDFRLNDGFKKAMAFAKQQGFYRQKYCGCEFSIKNVKI